MVRRYLEVWLLAALCRTRGSGAGLPRAAVEPLWDCLVLRPNTPEDAQAVRVLRVFRCFGRFVCRCLGLCLGGLERAQMDRR